MLSIQLLVEAIMKKYLILLLLIFPSFLYAGGPSMPDGYRMPNKDELSLSLRDDDKYRFSMASGDFNGDGLDDAAILSVDVNEKELVIYVFLCTDNDQVYKWYKLDTLKYQAVKYTGVRTIKSQTTYYYQTIKSETKSSFELINDAFELFQFEGSSSVFYFDHKLNSFNRIWTTK